MRKLVTKMSMSLDGFIGGPNGEADWLFKTTDTESTAWSLSMAQEAGMVIMGRKSFQMMANYWPTASNPFAGLMNELPKAVFTKSGFAGVDLPNAEQSAAVASWAEARIFDGDLAEGINTLKAEPGKRIYAAGGAEFMRSLIKAGLIDEFQLAIHPVVLGKGQPIFTEVVNPVYLKLVDVKSFPAGIVVHIYHPA